MKLALTLPGNTVLIPPSEIVHTLPPPGSYGLGFIGVAIGMLFIIAAVLALGFIVYGGIKWITSEGDPKNIQGARNMIIYAVIGLMIVFLAYFAVNIISKFLNVSLLPN